MYRESLDPESWNERIDRKEREHDRRATLYDDFRSEALPRCSSTGCYNQGRYVLYNRPYCEQCTMLVQPELVSAIQKEAVQ